ncbi:MAG: hypothetical protein ACI4BC_00345 [Muribaculaceae bacterium]
MRFRTNLMRKAVTVLLCAMAVTSTMTAQNSILHTFSTSQTLEIAAKHGMEQTARKHMLKVNALDANTIITEQPEGKVYDNLVVSQNAIAYNPAIGYYDGSTDCSFGTVVEGNDGYIYIKDIAPDAYMGSWVKAQKCENDTIVIHRQLIGSYDYGNGIIGELFVCKMSYDPVTKYWASVDGDTDIKLIWKDGQLTTPNEMNVEDPYYVVGVEEYIRAQDVLYFNDAYWNMHFYPQNDVYAELPANAAPIDMTLSYYAQDGTAYKTHSQVFFDGDDVYVQTDNRCPGWFKGHIDGDKVTFNNAQYLGRHSLYDAHEYFITGKRVPSADDVSKYVIEIVDGLTLDYDAATKTMVASEGIFFTNGGKQKINCAQRFDRPMFYLFQDLPYTPSDPVITNFWDYDEAYKSAELDFSITPLSVENEDLDTKYLFYNIYVDDEVFTFTPEEYKTFDTPTTDIPFGFEDNEGWILSTIVRIFHQPSKNMGIQAIYKGGDETRKSNIVFFDVNSREISTVPDGAGIKGINTTLDIIPEAYYSLDGRRYNEPQQGMNIVRMSDGSVLKVMVNK